MTLPVTTVTTAADDADDLKPSDYRDIYDELRSKAALRKFVDDIVHSQYSIAWWSKYERNEIALTRQARQELRVAVGLTALPPTIAEVAATIDPDATVYQVGLAAATRVVMVGCDVSEPINLHLNGRVDILDEPTHNPPQKDDVTLVTSSQRPRTPSKAIRVSPAAFNRLSDRRRASGLTWDAFLTTLLGEEN